MSREYRRYYIKKGGCLYRFVTSVKMLSPNYSGSSLSTKEQKARKKAKRAKQARKINQKYNKLTAVQIKRRKQIKSNPNKLIQ